MAQCPQCNARVDHYVSNRLDENEEVNDETSSRGPRAVASESGGHGHDDSMPDRGEPPNPTPSVATTITPHHKLEWKCPDCQYRWTTKSFSDDSHKQ